MRADAIKADRKDDIDKYTRLIAAAKRTAVMVADGKVDDISSLMYEVGSAYGEHKQNYYQLKQDWKNKEEE